MAQKVMKIHPLCRMFSQIAPLSKDERRDMLEDIKANGIKIPLLVTKNKGEILDGYTRWGIAYDLKLKPSEIPMEVFKGKPEDIESEILSRNMFRRHLTDEQRLALATKILGPKLEAEAKERQSAAGTFKGKAAIEGKGSVAESIAKKTGTSIHKAKQMEKVRKAGLLDDVISKKTTARKASKSIGTKKRKPKKELSFEDALYKRWTAWINKVPP